MNNYRDIIKAPIITEKSGMMEGENKYVFEVSRTANKVNIKQAIEALFDVKVESVNIINVKPKTRRVGRYEGKTNKVKKAIVTLREGSSIKLD